MPKYRVLTRMPVFLLHPVKLLRLPLPWMRRAATWGIPLLYLLVWNAFAQGSTRYAVLHSVDASTCRSWIDRMAKAGYRPVFLNAFATGAGVQLAAVAVH